MTETLELLKKLGFNVSLCDKEKLPMPSSDLEIQNLVHELITNSGVDFFNSNEELRFIKDDNKIKSIHYQGRVVDFDLILISTGFKPNNSLAMSSQISLGEYGGIKIDNRLRTSDINIYAAGDNVEVVNKITNRPEYIPLSTIAHNYGHIAGRRSNRPKCRVADGRVQGGRKQCGFGLSDAKKHRRGLTSPCRSPRFWQP